MEPQRPDADDMHTLIQQHNDDELPQCKIKRNYSCNHCTYFTQNPRFYLTHLRDIHGERIVINKCNLCLYASRHYQKLVRHMKMVHGSTEGITGQSRKRPAVEESAWSQLQKKIPTPTIIFPIETTTDFANLPNDLELSRKSLKDIAALYFAENQIDKIMTQMEEADAVQLPQPACDLSPVIKGKGSGGTFFDELKNSFVEKRDLACECGYASKCFSESVIHKKSCNYLAVGERKNEMAAINLNSRSTRCQQCRRRCKSSVDLLKHLENCSQASPMLENTEMQVNNDNGDSSHPIEGTQFVRDKVLTLNGCDILEDIMKEKCERVNVGKDLQASKCAGEDIKDKNFTGIETATNFGEIPNKKNEEEATSSSLKKVFKCPCCSFWASTASRFHVHIVGHLNKKPFKCSLCAYRSNWRWDITKHIRIKTIRNPSHKNARVIMSDETGRRNYTKYNKYIILMKLTDEDGDPRQIRCGEMTPNQEASLSFLNDLKRRVVAPVQLNQKEDNTETLFNQAGRKRSTPPLVKPNEDLIRDVQTKGHEKNAFFNCRKCHFRHANRDAVLAHVKIHHQDAGCLTPSCTSTANALVNAVESLTKHNMNKDFADALCLSPKHILQESKTHSDSNNNQQSTLPHCEGLLNSSLPNDGTPAKEAVDHLNPKTDAIETDSSILPASCPAGISMICTSPVASTTDRAPSKPVMAMGVTASANFINDTSDRREPSPFRCGHCHQVSNWKHVIQRHCRLKHSGHIQIEAFDRNSNGSAPMYRPLDFHGNGSSRSLLGLSGGDDNKLEAIKSHQPQQHQNKELIKSKSKNEHPTSSDSNKEIPRSSPKPSLISKQVKCPTCPYVSDDKVQLNFHISLHKAMQYECHKNQHLSSHLKSHDKPVAVVDPKKSSDDKKSTTVAAIQTISYCPSCPEVFVNNSKKLQQHLTVHGADLDFKCDVCDFSTKQKSVLHSHALVHTSTYKEKAELLAKDGKEDTEYPAQKMEQVTQSKLWVIVGSQKKSLENHGCLPNAQINAASEESVDSNTEPQKCPYCPFQSASHKSLQCHLQYHTRVSKRLEKHVCEHCDFSTSSKINLAEHTRIHVEGTDRVSNFTSNEYFDNDDEKKPVENSIGDSKVPETIKKPEKEMTSNRQSSKRSSAPKDEKKPAQPLSSHKTILVNPKTGQVIKRN